MKKLLLILPLLILTACTEDPQVTKINDCYYQVGDHIEYWQEWHDPQFKKDHITKSVLENSDPETFEPIDHPYSSSCYAKDKNQVYTNRSII
ncbi:DKNYY domain-containing protein, partial [Candidatus Venteria ishoeyi]